jgi:hypothetical protein
MIGHQAYISDGTSYQGWPTIDDGQVRPALQAHGYFVNLKVMIA